MQMTRSFHLDISLFVSHVIIIIRGVDFRHIGKSEKGNQVRGSFSATVACARISVARIPHPIHPERKFVHRMRDRYSPTQ